MTDTQTFGSILQHNGITSNDAYIARTNLVGLAGYSFEVHLRDTTNNAFTSTSILSLAPSLDLNNFNHDDGLLFHLHDPNQRLKVTWSRFDVVSIPLPAPALMGAAGLSLTCLRRRR